MCFGEAGAGEVGEGLIERGGEAVDECAVGGEWDLVEVGEGEVGVVGGECGGDGAEEGAFAAAGGAGDEDEVAGVEGEVEVLEEWFWF